ncbi:peptidoglycan DD-metalloendopeptidase family protein [Planococcus sp. N028]|uniref:Peptidoglycan DD-metalloendopeptidase family protein n=1 Tax=Planococcus shixiaomingii TaxID=3058393 RepID=A0ABT8N3V7_9BACL|nr:MULTISPECIES: peptidoglycan DD-metalloendopeptidase family protein [unclassified Planococcus (in: firmicutes)]MDN7242567.1 peptidoglycan DD-metalloendopeptidase family protein [Planococcus sp. N028]WKA54802.1 peptidoglycan DD-metalloendopeptidase family protein [Planococcus sp. N022]
MKYFNGTSMPSSSNILKAALASTLLMASFTVQPASAKPSEEDSLETIYHLYNSSEYIGAVAHEEAIESAIDEKIENVEAPVEGLNLLPSQEFRVIEERVFKPIVRDEQATMEQLNQKVAIKAETFALAVNNEIAIHLKDRDAYNETVRRLKLAHVSPEELEAWEVAQDSSEELPELKAGETRITDLSFNAKISGLSQQTAPEEVVTVDQAVDFLLNEHKVAVNVTKEQKIEEVYKHDINEKEDASLFIGDSKVDVEGKDGKKELTFAIQEENGEEVARQETAMEITEKPVGEVVLKGTKELPTVGTGKFEWPAEGGYISSERGKRWGRWHNGIDIARPDGFAIKAADHGIVKTAGPAGTLGNHVVIDHQNGYETIYGHLESIGVKKGDKVQAGTKLGKMGTTGRSTGIHLHFEISLDGTTKNPLDYLK